MRSRPRRNRQSEAIRSLTQETFLRPEDFIYPVFIVEGSQQVQAIDALPGQNRYSLDTLLKVAEQCVKKGIRGMALFPKIEDNLKDAYATEAINPEGLVPRALQTLKKHFPELLIVSDIALDPYSSMGHDGLVDEQGCVLNDPSLKILSDMALVHAQAGADFVGPSDMMDGRVRAIRDSLDKSNYKNCGIISYTAKYASAYYGPFRSALDSAPRAGDKKSYQMDPANHREALRELKLDTSEGADVVMVKPALAYLDIIKMFSQKSALPIAAYNVSGEYAMIKAAAEKGWLDEAQVRHETLLSIKRAGADMIFSYFALEEFS